ncbi:MAG: iron ABC transporter permease [Sphaerochaetaceae bacterium]|nr:iron ABC transporter permease [Sphaerochaetaceae bacterium]
MIILILLFIGLSLIALSVGPANIPVDQTVRILLSGPETVSAGIKSTSHNIIWNLRFPRILAGAVTGAALAVSGMVYQAIFKNPMSDPFVLGISSGAAFSVAFASYIGIVTAAAGVWTVPIVAFAGSLGTSMLIFVLSNGIRRSPTTLLLTGIALNFLLSALMTLFLYLNRAQLQNIMQWTMGSFSNSSWTKVIILSISSLIGIIPIFAFIKELDLLLLDNFTAVSIGMNIRSVRIILLILCTVSTSVTVAFFGIIGFVGLMVPHIMRILVGPRHRNLLPVSIIGGAVMVIASDTISRIAISPSELPVGVITSLFGAPLFIILLVNNKKRR